jgi:hypothetical protein
VSLMGEMRNAYKSLVEKPEGNRPLMTPRRSVRILLKWILQRKIRFKVVD